MPETMADLLIAAQSAQGPTEAAAARSRLARALSETGPVLFRGIVYRGTWTPEKWHVQGDGAEVLEMMRVTDPQPNSSLNGNSKSHSGDADPEPAQFSPDLLPPETEIAKTLGVPLATDVPAPDGI